MIPFDKSSPDPLGMLYFVLGLLMIFMPLVMVKNKKSVLIGLLFIVGGFFIFKSCQGMVKQGKKYKEWNAAFASNLERDIHKYSDPAKLERNFPPSPYLHGKIIALLPPIQKIDAKSFDHELYEILPKSLLPNDYSEAKTLILLTYSDHSIGNYSGGQNAYRIDCQVILIDMETNKIIDEKTFEGSAPPKVINGRAKGGWGYRPDYEIKKYLVALPQR